METLYGCPGNLFVPSCRAFYSQNFHSLFKIPLIFLIILCSSYEYFNVCRAYLFQLVEVIVSTSAIDSLAVEEGRKYLEYCWDMHCCCCTHTIQFPCRKSFPSERVRLCVAYVHSKLKAFNVGFSSYQTADSSERIISPVMSILHQRTRIPNNKRAKWTHDSVGFGWREWTETDSKHGWEPNKSAWRLGKFLRFLFNFGIQYSSMRKCCFDSGKHQHEYTRIRLPTFNEFGVCLKWSTI